MKGEGTMSEELEKKESEEIGIYVDQKNGRDVTGNGTKEKPFRTMKRAQDELAKHKGQFVQIYVAKPEETEEQKKMRAQIVAAQAHRQKQKDNANRANGMSGAMMGLSPSAFRGALRRAAKKQS